MAHKSKAPQGNPDLRQAILEIVDNQLQANDPPETRQTYDRLKEMGYNDGEARNLIGCVMMNEIYEIMGTNKPYNHDRYVAALNKLPTLPWD